MKCDRCENEATVHEVMIKGGKRQEKHLCEACAKSAGTVQAPAAAHAPITELLTEYITTQAAGAGAPATGAPAATNAVECSECGMSYAQFRHSGLLGCARCYSTFEGQLSPLLARAHEGGTHHTGKSPRRGVEPGASAANEAAAVAAGLERRAAVLRQQLAEAVAGEQYERAAAIRDELAKLERPPRQGGGGRA
jgi:protein arginine kinase activator